MQTGFKIHKSAVMIECTLNHLIDCANGKVGSEVADITMIYEQPISFVTDVLETLLVNEYDVFIKDMKLRYSPFKQCALSQLEEIVCHGLCDDLQLLLRTLKANTTRRS